MVQIFEEVIEIEGPKVKQIKAQASKEREVDELLGDLNPRYFEKALTPKNALDRVYANRNINHLIGPF